MCTLDSCHHLLPTLWLDLPFMFDPCFINQELYAGPRTQRLPKRQPELMGIQQTACTEHFLRRLQGGNNCCACSLPMFVVALYSPTLFRSLSILDDLRPTFCVIAVGAGPRLRGGKLLRVSACTGGIAVSTGNVRTMTIGKPSLKPKPKTRKPSTKCRNAEPKGRRSKMQKQIAQKSGNSLLYRTRTSVDSLQPSVLPVQTPAWTAKQLKRL